MNIFVTGATGRVGRRTAPWLASNGHSVRALVRGEQQAAEVAAFGAEAVLGDLLEPASLQQVVAGCDAVVHLAALFRGARPEDAVQTNYAGSIALAHAARAAGVQRFVYISTNLVYGPGRGRPTTEDDQPEPGGQAYPRSKLAGEQALAKVEGLDLRIARLAFVYGDGDPHLLEALRWSRTWNAEKRLQTVHHVDVARAIGLIVAADQPPHRLYNVADMRPLTGAELLELNGLPPEPAADVPLDDSWEGIVSIARIQQDLDFTLQYPSAFDAQKDHAL